VHSPLVGVDGNIAGGHRHTPITFWTRALHEQPLERDSDGNLVEFLDGKHDMFPKIKTNRLTDSELVYARTGDETPQVGDRYHNKDESWVYGTSLPMRSFKDNVAFGCGGGFDLRGGLSFRNPQPKLHRAVHSGNLSYNTGKMYLSDGSELGQENFQSSGNVGLDHRYVGNLLAKSYRLVGDGTGVGVYNNFSYVDDLHVKDSEIRNWSDGVVPPAYGRDSKSTVRNSTFTKNETDIHLPNRFGGEHGKFLADGNNYSGSMTLEWDEITPSVMVPDRIIDVHSNVTFEGRTVYHRWSDPDFVLVEESDTERLDKMMNRAEDKWRDVLNGDDPRQVLPGATHQELYNQYGFTFYGGLLKPTNGEERPDFGGSGGTYDSTPFLGPQKSMPTDEIWIDAANKMSFKNDYKIVSYSDGNNIQNYKPLQFANDETAVQLDSPSERDYSPPFTDTGIASYQFELDTAGTYHVHTRCQQGKTSETPKGGDVTSRFHLRIDDGDWKLHDGNSGLAGTDEFSWRHEWWAEFDLTEGVHTLEIAGSGWGMRLDWVLLKHETVAANPQGMGLSHTT
jgi:hypothetical protein